MDLFYQKYRPVKISQLDSEMARETLTKILSQKNLPQAFLFAGPKGIGKTSAARVLAKSLNCPKAKKGEPCGRCPTCLEIGRGESLDVLEIDAASNRGIDDIRALKEKINLQPLKAKNKIYIIDEVHMLTREAFNAILKTLEEPPPHVYFVFCTTNPEKIPETVLSRLTRIDFRRATDKEIIRALKRVTRGEKIRIGKEILALIAASADGSFRDAHKIFYQLWLENKGRVSLKAAKQALSRWQEATPWHLLKLIGESKIKEAVVLFEELAQRRIDWQEYGRRLVGAIQKILLAKLEIKIEEKRAKELASSFTKRQIVALAREFNQALIKAKKLPLPWLSFQLAVIGLENETGGENEEKVVEKFSQAEPAESDLVGQSVKNQRLSLSILKEKWTDFLQVVKPLNHSVCALLRAARPKKIDKKYVVLEVFYQFHKDQLEQEHNRRIVESALASLFQTPLRIKCELGQKPTRSPEPSLKPNNDQSLAKSSDDDLYQMAKDIFGE